MGAGGESYGGAIGRTRLEAVHLSCGCGRTYVSEIVRSIDAAHDPELAAQLASGSLNRPLCPSCGRTGRVDVPIVEGYACSEQPTVRRNAGTLLRWLGLRGSLAR